MASISLLIIIVIGQFSYSEIYQNREKANDRSNYYLNYSY